MVASPHRPTMTEAESAAFWKGERYGSTSGRVEGAIWTTAFWGAIALAFWLGRAGA